MKYQVCKVNDVLASAYQNIISGKPDIFDVISEHDTINEARKAAEDCRVIIRRSDDISPADNISEFYRIDPTKEPELAKRISTEWNEWQNGNDRSRAEKPYTGR